MASGEPNLMLGMSIASHPIDARRVFVADLFAGGAIAAVLADVAPTQIAAVANRSERAVGAAYDMPSAFAAMQGRSVAALRYGGVLTIVLLGDPESTVRAIEPRFRDCKYRIRSREPGRRTHFVVHSRANPSVRDSRNIDMYGRQERLLKGATFVVMISAGAASIVALSGDGDSIAMDDAINARSVPLNSPVKSSTPHAEPGGESSWVERVATLLER